MEKDQAEKNQNALEDFEKMMLDDYCSEILKIFWRTESMRFNEVYRALIDRGMKISKPTLTEHLKHLTKKKWLSRRVTGFQSVTYTLHGDILKNRHQSSTTKDILEKFMKLYGSERSPELRADYAMNIIFARALEDFLVRFSVELETGNKIKFKKSKANDYEDTVLRDCAEDPEFKKVILETANRVIEALRESNDIALEAERITDYFSRFSDSTRFLEGERLRRRTMG
jgi:predicted transcriptional regulator